MIEVERFYYFFFWGGGGGEDAETLCFKFQFYISHYIPDIGPNVLCRHWMVEERASWCWDNAAISPDLLVYP